MRREEIRIRDPFIVVDEKTKTYYMYGTTDLEYDSYASYPKFSVYVSKDLENFEGPFVVFDGKESGFGLPMIIGRRKCGNIMANTIYSAALRRTGVAVQRKFYKVTVRLDHFFRFPINRKRLRIWNA